MSLFSNRIIATIAGLAVICGALGATNTPVSAAPATSVHARVISHAVVGAVASRHAVRTGIVASDTEVRFEIALQPPHFAAEQAFVQSLGERGSPNFGHYLTPAQMTARFAPSVRSEQTTIAWLVAHGITIDKTYSDRLLLDVSGTARAIDSAFKFDLATYRAPGVTSFYANDRNPTLPAAVSNLVQNVIVNSYPVGHSNAIPLHETPAMRHAKISPTPNGTTIRGNGNPRTMRAMMRRDNAGRHGGSNVRPAYTCEPDNSHCYIDDNNLWSSDGYDVQALYNQGHCCNPFNSPTNSSPVDASIDIVGACGFNYNDATTFFKHYGMAWNITSYNVDGGPGANNNCANSSSGGGFETTLDVEQAVAMGNNYGCYCTTAHVYVYLSPADAVLKNGGPGMYDTTFFDLWNAAYSGNDARVMSMSWGGGENGWAGSDEDTGHGILNMMAGAGYSTMISAGDAGAYEGGGSSTPYAQYPAADPATTSVGGTQLEYAGDGTTYQSEAAWNSGGGGCSIHFAAWSYQTENGFDSLCGGNRSQPDIAIQAGCGPGEAIYFGGGWGGVCGTSDAAPALAGITAQMDAYSLAQGSNCGSAGNGSCAPLGLLNWYIWHQGILSNYAPHQPFYDITSGDNDNGTGTGVYPTLTGYDLATGWGSVNALQFYRMIDWYHTWEGHAPIVTFGGAGSGWYNSSAQVTWTISDPLQGTDAAESGVGGFTQAWDADPGDPYHDATPGPATDSFLTGPQFPNGTSGFLDIPGVQGCHTVNVRVWDNAGLSTDAQMGGMCYDTIPPYMTNISLSPGSPSNVSSVQINATATDPGCGSTGSCVDYLDYYVNTAADGSESGTWKYLGRTYGSSGNFDWSTSGYNDGIHLIAVDPTDNAGNSDYCSGIGSSHRASCAQFVLDRTAPVSKITLDGKRPASKTYVYPVKITLSASDPSPGSGVAATYYKIDHGPWQLYSAPFKLYSAGPGTHVVYYYSTDRAGNSEAYKSIKVKVKPPAKTFKVIQKISKKGSIVLGDVALNYAGLSCTVAKCTYKGIVPNVTITFSESPNRPSTHAFTHWVVNGTSKKGTSIQVKIKANTTVSAIYK